MIFIILYWDQYVYTDNDKSTFIFKSFGAKHALKNFVVICEAVYAWDQREKIYAHLEHMYYVTLINNIQE